MLLEMHAVPLLFWHKGTFFCQKMRIFGQIVTQRGGGSRQGASSRVFQGKPHACLCVVFTQSEPQSSVIRCNEDLTRIPAIFTFPTTNSSFATLCLCVINSWSWYKIHTHGSRIVENTDR